MRQLEVLVEEPSAARLLSSVIPRVIDEHTSWAIREFAGKPDLLRNLPARLRGYASMATSVELRVIVLADRDDEDCLELKARLEALAADAGLPTKSTSSDFVVVNRIAVEELEAWYFGDVGALRRVYPRLPSSLAAKAKYRDPDAITGGTWEQLERLLQQHGYERGGLRKTALAAQIGEHLDISHNRSTSFNHFIAGVRAAVA